MIIIFYYYDYDYYLLLLLSLFLLSLSLSLSLLLFIIIMIIIITIIMIIIIIITVRPHYDPGTAPSRTVPASSYGTIEGARHRRRPIRLGAVLRNHDAAARRSRRSAYACSASICCAPPHERACMRPPAFARRKPHCVPEPVVAVETFTCSSVGQGVCRPLNTLQNCGQGTMTRTMQCTSSTRGQVPVYIGSMSALSRHLRAYGHAVGDAEIEPRHGSTRDAVYPQHAWTGPALHGRMQLSSDCAVHRSVPYVPRSRLCEARL